jgi:hypothetical protein
MHVTAISVVSTVRRTDETPTPTRTHVEESASASKPVNHSNGPQCAHCGWRGGGHACVLCRQLISKLLILFAPPLQVELPLQYAAPLLSIPLMLIKLSRSYRVIAPTNPACYTVVGLDLFCTFAPSSLYSTLLSSLTPPFLQTTLSTLQLPFATLLYSAPLSRCYRLTEIEIETVHIP